MGCLVTRQEINNMTFKHHRLQSHTKKGNNPKVHPEGASSVKNETSIQEILGSPQNVMRQYICIEMERSPRKGKSKLQNNMELLKHSRDLDFDSWNLQTSSSCSVPISENNNCSYLVAIGKQTKAKKKGEIILDSSLSL